MNTLTLVPSWQSEVTHRHDVLVAKFGDGYAQRREAGLNAKAMRWVLVFEKVTREKAAAIIAFFTEQGRVEPFLWTPPAPYATETQWILDSDVSHVKHGFDSETITVELEQDFNPTPP